MTFICVPGGEKAKETTASPLALCLSLTHDLFVDREKEVEGPRLEGARRGFARKKIYNIFLSLSVNTRHTSTIDYWCLMPEGSEEERTREKEPVRDTFSQERNAWNMSRRRIKILPGY